MTGTASLCSFSLMNSLPSTGTPGFLRSVSVGLPSASCLFVLMRPMIRLASVTLGGRFCLAFYSGLPKARISYCLGTSISISTPHSPPPPAFWTILDAFALWIPSTSTATPETPTPGTLPMDLELPGLITSLFPGFGRCHRPVAGLTPPLTGANNAPITLLFNPGSGAMYTLAVTPGQEDPGLTPQLCGLLRGSRSCARSAEACQFLEYDVHRHAKAIEDHLWTGLLAHFPAPKSTCKRDCFRSDTWRLRGKREWLRKRIHAASKYLRAWDLRGAFTSWRCRRPLCVACAAMHVPLLWLLNQSSSRTTGSLVKSSARLFAETPWSTSGRPQMPLRSLLQRQLSSACACSQAARNANAVTLPPLPAVELANGSLAATAEEAKARWLEHFSSIEDGHVKDPVSIVHDCYRRQNSKDLDSYSVRLQEVPDLRSLEWALRDTATARAYGQDGVPGEVAHYCAAELSKVLFQLQLKSVFRLCEPVQHKGGVLHCVWKRKGPKQQCASYRGILVSSILGKSLHKLLRQKCVTALSTVTSPLQVGGLPRYPVTVPAHASRLFQSACHRRGLCHSIVFLDLQEAFYRIVRPLITGGPLTQEAIAAACRAVNLPSGVYHEIQAHLQQPALLQGAGASEWATRALAETLQDTWFKFPGEPELVVTTIGSRPGDSLSDLVFSLLFGKVLARIRQTLRAAGHVTTIPWHASMTGRLQPLAEPVHETVELLDSTWMDDLSLILRAKDSTALLDRLCTALLSCWMPALNMPFYRT